jgi:hypothetical protein
MSHPASVQTLHLSLEHIDEDVLCLAGNRYRAILEVGSINFGLQGEAEQEVVMASFAAVLNSLTYPIQVLVRVLPIDLDRYLGDLERRTRTLSDELADLGHDYVTFLRRLARNRTLLERRFYLVVPTQTDTSNRRPWPFRRENPVGDLETARRQLTFRCEEVERQLARCGLPARRLRAPELARLFYACWCPDLAGIQRLVSEPDPLDSLAIAAGQQQRRS